MREALRGFGEFCTETLERHRCPSVSVAVVDHGEVVLAEAYGTAELTTGRAATADTVYRLASVTKAITATAVCTAVDQGALRLDDPLPGRFTGADRRPTIRQTLQHRAGFGAHYDWQYGVDGPAVPTAWYGERLYREPGSGFEYANLGYRALGSLLEGLDGGSLEQQLLGRVAEPLGLDSIRVGPEYPGPAPVAERYTADGRAYPVCRSGHPAAGDAWGTATDAARFAGSCARLLRPDTVAAVFDAPPIGPHQGYGVGWSVSRGPGPVVHSHSGGMGGVGNMVAHVPDRQLAVAVLTNSTDKSARDAVLRHLLGRLVPGFDPVGLSALPDTTRPLTLPAGSWSGRIDTREGAMTLHVDILMDRQVSVHLNGVGQATATGSASADWDLRTLVPLQLPTADARIASPALALELRLHGGELTGAARALKLGDTDGWLGNYLSHPCTLTPR